MAQAEAGYLVAKANLSTILGGRGGGQSGRGGGRGCGGNVKVTSPCVKALDHNISDAWIPAKVEVVNLTPVLVVTSLSRENGLRNTQIFRTDRNLSSLLTTPKSLLLVLELSALITEAARWSSKVSFTYQD
jgi:hypothetical protein